LLASNFNGVVEETIIALSALIFLVSLHLAFCDLIHRARFGVCCQVVVCLASTTGVVVQGSCALNLLKAIVDVFQAFEFIAGKGISFFTDLTSIFICVFGFAVLYGKGTDTFCCALLAAVQVVSVFALFTTV
jgi:hypothetical protein